MANGSLVTPFDGHAPQIDPTAFVDPSARIIGRVTLAQGAMVWPGAVLRADDERIEVGQGSAVLDLALLEAPQDHPVIVEPGALVSHQVCVHGATVKSGALVGIGAIVLDGAVVGSGALVGAGAVVPPRMQIPEGVLVLGQPAKVVRDLKPAEVAEVARQLADLAVKVKIYLSQMA
ncbi:MAG: gamma carbonic anhydrase family protein [Desulfarculaceae bacterium]|nr:gamma carbonic anhydrase family protein [Desulfarculaceae bacterium]MCF8046171.1 gamma carbonic anhydrase family protein [Desulfarculaceae bacterium]MCF8066118.1 gamma carbonic anhydrase family protein [Desulfarculaceae bacterium]MCF8098844.1 gamma carbonic anhydrase family protein [Desulfarculaceae bacterium]MCF8124191.1 gamma carbonic anhydrase family protein [Desulfarculaceae bacterium]